MNDEEIPRIGLSDDGSATAEANRDDEWVRQLLGRLPEASIPDDVSQRVLSALADESRARTGGNISEVTHLSASAPGTPVTPDSAAEASQATSNRRWWWAAGGVAATGIGVALALSALPDGSQPGNITAEASSVVQPEQQTPDSFAADAVKVVPVSSGSTYTAQNVRLRVPQVMESATGVASPEVLRATFAATPAGIDSCLAGIGFPPQDLALLDIARFQDSPVAVLAYLTDADDGTADVVVVGVRCSKTDPQVRHRDVADMAAREVTRQE